ncbi:hypothetical protein, partial [Photorhabdus cinerea]
MVIKEIGNNDILKENDNNGLTVACHAPLVYPPAETGFQLFFGPAMTITGFEDPQADNKEGQSETAKRAFPHPPPPVPCQSRASETVLTVLSPV